MMAEKMETFLITIAILEGRHYIWTNMDSAVMVQIENKKKCTGVKRNTDAPQYNEYFVFEFVSTLEAMLEKTITITVIQPKTACRARKILGDFNMDVATLWSQKSHQFYHKWAIIGKNDDFSGPRGYLKIDISLLYKGQVSEVPTDFINDEIEGNLLLPNGLYRERQKALYLFDVYKCECLVEKPSITVNDNRNSGKAPNTYVEITFAGQKVRTSVKKNTHSPVFNEQLTIMDLFPPLCQRIKIEICYSESCRKTINATRYLDLKLISNHKEEGFLPTFGPTYLHMYFNNNLGGFAGKILISLNTELQEILPTDAKTTGTIVKSIPPLSEENQFEDILLFATIIEATAISKTCGDRVVSFRVTFGSTLVQRSLTASGDGILTNATAALKPKKIGNKYYYLPLENEKPCLVITRKLPSCRKRMYNSNILYKLTKELKLRLRTVEEEFEKRHYKLSKDEINDILMDTLDFLRTSGKKYIDIVQEYNFQFATKLDRERKKMCLKEMTDIINKVDKICNSKLQKETLGKLQKLCDRIEALIFDVQDCWPDLHMWMLFGNKKVAYCRIPARDIIFSPIDEEKGEYCGKIRTICFYPHPKDQVHLSCKMDLILWLGLERHKHDCFKSIPDGFKFQKETILGTRKILADEKYIFHLRAHIFQGKISPGFDRTGLADMYIKLIVKNRQAQTRVINAKLNPMWDQTIVIPELTFYGSKSYLKLNVPNVLIELWDRDQCKADDTVGRTYITPIIKFREDPYVPPKLSWHKSYQGAEMFGEILAAFEYIEVPEPEDDFQMPPKQKFYRIPEEIKPHMVPHRIEVLFWGVRDLGKLYCIQMNRPRISVICQESTLVSDTIDNAKKNSNFPNKSKCMDVALPLEREYCPPLCIKLHDSRRFGIYYYAGVHISDVYSYLHYPITIEERNKRMAEYSFVKPPSDSSSIVVSHTNIKFNGDNSLPNPEKEKEKPFSAAWWKDSFKHLNHSEDKFHGGMGDRSTPKCELANCTSMRNYVKQNSQDKYQCLKSPAPNSESEKEKTCNYSWCKNWFKMWKTELKEQKSLDKTKLTDWFKEMNFEKLKNKKSSKTSLGTYEPLPQDDYDPDDFDWWTKFYASVNMTQDNVSSENVDEQEVPKHTLKIYPNELEAQPEFNWFADMFMSFGMYRGKRTGDETIDEENITAYFKGLVKIYRWPQENEGDYITDRGLPLRDGIFQNYPDNFPVRFLLRVYCVRGLGLRPKDLSGKSDPYLYLTLNGKIIRDREHYIPRQVNPVFGRLFEFNGFFPNDHILQIAVWDYDKGSSDDLIGETLIDIENRFYSKHRAFCGIADHYTESGYCEWRGHQKPTAILSELCKTWGLENPEYLADSVRIGMKLFITEDFKCSFYSASRLCGSQISVSASEDADFDKEVLALTVLRRWGEMPVVGFLLVPEHVETRSLYNPKKPGIEQGKIQLWIDIFPVTELPAPRSVEITPKKPLKYELRVIIWNTEEVVLTEDDFFLGERKSDIYVKGWITDNRDAQYTDVHYKSLTGEGNFNWRFIFPFEYLTTENKLVMRRKESAFAIDETEFKIPCKLTLQVWDNDTFSRDDFLGTLSLELSRMPRGARAANKCTLSIMETKAPKINLFKVRCTKGWWPFQRFDEKLGKYTLQGKVEVELEIVTSEEAERSPAGLGRHNPQSLPTPRRPDVSFSWFKNPLKALKYVICKLHRRKIISAFLIILLVALVLVGIYAVPGYMVKHQEGQNLNDTAKLDMSCH